MEPARVLSLYRHILRAAQRFPSVKRQQVLEDIRLEFRANKASPPVGCVRASASVGDAAERGGPPPMPCVAAACR